MGKRCFGEIDGCYWLDRYSREQLRTRLAQAGGTIEEEALVLAGCQRRLEALGEELA